MVDILTSLSCCKAQGGKTTGRERRCMETKKIAVLLNLKQQKIRDPENEVGEYILYAQTGAVITLTVTVSRKHNTTFKTSVCDVCIRARGIRRGWQQPFVEVVILGITVYDWLRVIIELVEKHGFEIEPDIMLEEVRKLSQFKLPQ